MPVAVRGVAWRSGLFFWFQGAKLVLPFAWIELAAVGAAFLGMQRGLVNLRLRSK
jgi:uncharacterized membrane protein